MLARVLAWYSLLPEAERDLPILILDGVAWTPRAIVAEVERGTPTGERLQALIESGRLGTEEEELRRLAKLRLRMLLERYPRGRPLVAALGVPVRVYAPEDLIREVEEETELGRRLIETEVEHVRYLLSLGGEA